MDSQGQAHKPRGDKQPFERVSCRRCQIRLKNFGKDIHFHSPGFKHYESDDFSTRSSPKFVDVSITGKYCELMCDHCASKIL